MNPYLLTDFTYYFNSVWVSSAYNLLLDYPSKRPYILFKVMGFKDFSLKSLTFGFSFKSLTQLRYGVTGGVVLGPLWDPAPGYITSSGGF